MSLVEAHGLFMDEKDNGGETVRGVSEDMSVAVL
jgi:hypothetical protein